MTPDGEGAASFPAPTSGRGPTATDQRSCAAPSGPNHRVAMVSNDDAVKLARPFSVAVDDPWARIIATAVHNDRIGRPPRAPVAAALFELARLVESGLPMPAIQPAPDGGALVVSVSRDDLLEWILRFDLPGPDWECEQHGDMIYRSARWPLGAFEALPFRIICLDSVPVNPNAIDGATCVTRCQDCADFGLPGCVLSMGARS